MYYPPVILCHVPHKHTLFIKHTWEQWVTEETRTTGSHEAACILTKSSMKEERKKQNKMGGGMVWATVGYSSPLPLWLKP